MMSAGATGNKEELDRKTHKEKDIPGCELRGPVDLNCSVLRKCPSGIGCLVYRL